MLKHGKIQQMERPKANFERDPYKINNNKNKNILKQISFYDVK